MYLALCPIELETGETVNALPCPFCAAAADLEMFLTTTITDIDGTEEIETVWAVLCGTCQAQGPVGNEEDAVTAWNTRYFYQDDPDAPASLKSSCRPGEDDLR